MFSLLTFTRAGASEGAIALALERERVWRERDAKLIAEQWRIMQRAEQVGHGRPELFIFRSKYHQMLR